MDGIVSGWWDRHDPVAVRGVPGHITALYPFVPPESFDDTVADALVAVVSTIRVFDFTLSRFDEFPGAIWLRPEPGQPFRDLTRQLWAAFPMYPPYGGRFPDLQPHLTIGVVADGQDQAGLAARIRDDLGPDLPISCTAASLSVFMCDARGSWRREHRLELGR